MPQHTREEVKEYILKHVDEVVEDIQVLLLPEENCPGNCDDCWASVLCVKEGVTSETLVIAEDSEEGGENDSKKEESPRHE